MLGLYPLSDQPISGVPGEGVSPTNYVLTCSAGSYAYTGNSADLAAKISYSLSCSVGAYTYSGSAATLILSETSQIDTHDGAWRVEKRGKKKERYTENEKSRRAAVAEAYRVLMEPETDEAIAEEAERVIEASPVDEIAVDLVKVRALLALWEKEVARRISEQEEADDEEALLMLI